MVIQLLVIGLLICCIMTCSFSVKFIFFYGNFHSYSRLYHFGLCCDTWCILFEPKPRARWFLPNSVENILNFLFTYASKKLKTLLCFPDSFQRVTLKIYILKQLNRCTRDNRSIKVIRQHQSSKKELILKMVIVSYGRDSSKPLNIKI